MNVGAALRAKYADDVCTCEHARRHHYAPSGATVGCELCTCSAYAWSGATNPNLKEMK